MMKAQVEKRKSLPLGHLVFSFLMARRADWEPRLEPWTLYAVSLELGEDVLKPEPSADVLATRFVLPDHPALRCKQKMKSLKKYLIQEYSLL